MSGKNGGPDLRKRTPEEIAAEVRRREDFEFKKAQRKSDLGWMMGDKRGRRVVYSLLNSTGWLGSTLISGQPSAVLEGRRGVAIELVNEIMTDNHTNYLLMLKEAYDDASKA